MHTVKTNTKGVKSDSFALAWGNAPDIEITLTAHAIATVEHAPALEIESATENETASDKRTMRAVESIEFIELLAPAEMYDESMTNEQRLFD